MRILLLVVVLTGTAHGADIHDERSNRIGRTEERQGRIEVYDVQSSRIGEGVRQSDGSVEFRDQRRTRLPLIAQLPSGRIAQRPNRPIAASLPVPEADPPSLDDRSILPHAPSQCGQSHAPGGQAWATLLPFLIMP